MSKNMTSENNTVVCLAKLPGEKAELDSYFSARRLLTEVEDNHKQPRSAKYFDAYMTIGPRKKQKKTTLRSMLF